MKIKCKEIFKKYKSYNAKSVINGASFELESGNSLSISGPSGVGKSTLLNVLAGIDEVDKAKSFLMIYLSQIYQTQIKHYLD